MDCVDAILLLFSSALGGLIAVYSQGLREWINRPKISVDLQKDSMFEEYDSDKNIEFISITNTGRTTASGVKIYVTIDNIPNTKIYYAIKRTENPIDIYPESHVLYKLSDKTWEDCNILKGFEDATEEKKHQIIDKLHEKRHIGCFHTRNISASNSLILYGMYGLTLGPPFDINVVVYGNNIKAETYSFRVEVEKITRIKKDKFCDTVSLTTGKNYYNENPTVGFLKFEEKDKL